MTVSEPRNPVMLAGVVFRGHMSPRWRVYTSLLHTRYNSLCFYDCCRYNDGCFRALRGCTGAVCVAEGDSDPQQARTGNARKRGPTGQSAITSYCSQNACGWVVSGCGMLYQSQPNEVHHKGGVRASGTHQ